MNTKLLAAFLTFLACTPILGMASKREKASPVRYLAWMEGDFQSEYAPQRELARARLGRWKGDPPADSDTEKYLAYLATLGASGQHKESEDRIKAFLVKYPEEKRAVFLLGSHYLRTKRRELAEYFFLQLEKDSSFKWRSLLLNNLGKIALEQSRKERALKYFEQATQASPPIAAPYVNLGAIYLLSHNFPDAERMFLRATGIDEDFEDAFVGLGSAMEGMGRFSEAATLYKKFLDDHPRSLSTMYNYSILLGERLDQKQQAAQWMLQYIQQGGRESVRAQKIMDKWR